MGLSLRFRRAPSSAPAAASACTSPSRPISRASSPRAAGPRPTSRWSPIRPPAPGSPTRTTWIPATRSRSWAAPACRRRPGPGLLALVNQGRAAAGESTLNSSSPTETQQALYSLPQSDYNVITSGTNGYTAGAGYNLVTGLGTPHRVRREPCKVLIFSGCKSHPASGSLQPVAIEATRGGNETVGAFETDGSL